MANLKVYILLALAIFCYVETTQGQEDRIVGGITTTIDVTKYIVYLRQDGSFICGGSLIAPTYVVSAGHCVVDEQTGAVLAASRYIVHGGTSYLSQPGVARAVSKIVVPANFHITKSLTYDVSVLKLASPMTGTNIAPIGLCSTSMAAGNAVRVSGWGLTKENGDVSNQLRTVVVNMISRAQCEKDYGAAAITETMGCATDPGKDSCNGDSGGPLVFGGKLCGIVSWGIGCAKAGSPGVYTLVNAVKTFILNNTP